MAVSLIAALAVAAAAFSLWRLSRVPVKEEPIAERDFVNLAPGDVVLAAEGEWLVAARERLDAADLFALRAGREKRWLLAPAEGPLGFLPARPESGDLERAVALSGGRKLDRATVDLLPGSAQ